MYLGRNSGIIYRFVAKEVSATNLQFVMMKKKWRKHNDMKKIGVIIGAIVGAACAGITVYLLGNPFASAAVGFVWCYTGYFLGKYIEKKKGSNKQEKR